MLGDTSAKPAYRFNEWLELVRKRSGKLRSFASANTSKCLQSLSLPPRLCLSLLTIAETSTNEIH